LSALEFVFLQLCILSSFLVANLPSPYNPRNCAFLTCVTQRLPQWSRVHPSLLTSKRVTPILDVSQLPFLRRLLFLLQFFPKEVFLRTLVGTIPGLPLACVISLGVRLLGFKFFLSTTTTDVPPSYRPVFLFFRFCLLPRPSTSMNLASSFFFPWISPHLPYFAFLFYGGHELIVLLTPRSFHFFIRPTSNFSIAPPLFPVSLPESSG